MTEKQLQPLTALEIPVRNYADVVVVTNETPHALLITYGHSGDVLVRVFVRIMEPPPNKAIEPLWNIPQEHDE